MTPELKAKELVDKCYKYSHDIGQTKDSSKQCALICCNEILQALAENGVVYPHRRYEEAKEYWQQVKQAIELSNPTQHPIMNKEAIAKKYIDCRCGEAYISRGLTAPDCPYHSTDPESAMDEWAQIQSCLFAEWKDRHYYELNTPGYYAPYPKIYEPITKGYSISQLYNLYKQTIKP